MQVHVQNPNRWFGPKPYKVSVAGDEEHFFTLDDAKRFAEGTGIFAIITYFGEIVWTYSALCGWVEAGR